MAYIQAEYLYVIQLRGDAEAGRNIFKFGMSTQDPTANRFRGYEKGSRIWLVIIMNNAHDAEQEILKILRRKYKQRIDKGVEYFETDDVQEMLNDIWSYHQKTFKNIYTTSGEIDWKRWFDDAKDKIVHEHEKTSYIKTCDVNNGEFAAWLIENGWKCDIKQHVYCIDKPINQQNQSSSTQSSMNQQNQSSSTQSSMNQQSTQSSTTQSSTTQSSTTQQSTQSSTTQSSMNQQSTQQSTQSSMNQQSTQSSTQSSMNQQSTQSSTQSSSISTPSKLPPLFNRSNNHKIQCSIEGLGKLITSFLKTKNVSNKNVMGRFDVSTTPKQNILSILHVSLFEHEKELCSLSSLNEIIDNEAIDLQHIHLSDSKLKKLKLVLDPSITQYTMHIKSFEEKRFKPKRGKLINYLEVEFERTQ